MITLADIEAARERIEGLVFESPCAHSRVLSTLTGATLYLKLENLQMTGSFKERGACNRIARMDADERARGIVTASAGNHAQGVAFHARRAGVCATVVMPLSTALVKVNATRELGAEIRLWGGNFDEAQAEARRLTTERGAVFVPAFDDDDVMAGQGSIGLELLAQCPDLEAVIVPVGGGGLLAGVATAIKESRPSVRVYGVEADAVPSMQAALRAGVPTVVDARRSIADGISVRSVGARCLPSIARYVDAVIGVDEEAIAEAVLVLLEREKTVAEGAGATALAGALSGRLPIAGRRVAVLVSGGNVDVNLLSRIIDRGLFRSGRLARLRCILDDVPGALARLLDEVALQQANVLEVEHDRLGHGLELAQTAVAVLLETRGLGHIAEVQAALARIGIASSMAEAAPGTSSRRPSVPK